MRAIYTNDSKELKKLTKFTRNITDLGPFWNSDETEELIEIRREQYERRIQNERQQDKFQNLMLEQGDSSLSEDWLNYFNQYVTTQAAARYLSGGARLFLFLTPRKSAPKHRSRGRQRLSNLSLVLAEAD